MNKEIHVLEYALLLILAFPTGWWIGRKIGSWLGRFIGQCIVFCLGAKLTIKDLDGSETVTHLKGMKAVEFCNLIEQEKRRAQKLKSAHKYADKIQQEGQK